jgi:benzoylformate decarboxylase
MSTMTGRQTFVEILRAAGVSRIFGNPGTTELPLMDILVDYPDVHYLLSLHGRLSRGLRPHKTP